MVQTKTEWRRALLKVRSAIPTDVRRRDSALITGRVAALSCTRLVQSVLGYSAIGAEVDASAVFGLARITDLPGYRPVATDPGFPRWAAWTDAGQGNVVSASALPYPALVIVPGVGFDVRGGRLGRGAGFYDRALADLRRSGTVYVVGVGFECQVVAALPCDDWDERMDSIVTERRMIELGANAASTSEASR
jgi:5-formyltetrahydrofolate cyclo-ligase